MTVEASGRAFSIVKNRWDARSVQRARCPRFASRVQGLARDVRPLALDGCAFLHEEEILALAATFHRLFQRSPCRRIVIKRRAGVACEE